MFFFSVLHRNENTVQVQAVTLIQAQLCIEIDFYFLKIITLLKNDEISFKLQIQPTTYFFLFFLFRQRDAEQKREEERRKEQEEKRRKEQEEERRREDEERRREDERRKEQVT